MAPPPCAPAAGSPGHTRCAQEPQVHRTGTEMGHDLQQLQEEVTETQPQGSEFGTPGLPVGGDQRGDLQVINLKLSSTV